MSLKISIPKPCSENWNQMTPTQKGAFCQSCSKEVLDFTNTSKTELARKLDTNQNICGRFKPEQLDTPLPSITRSNFQRNAAILGFTSLLALTIPTAATSQTTKPLPVHEMKDDFILGRIAVQPVSKNTMVIRGVVSNKTQLLVGARVVLDGTEISTQTDSLGQYELTIPLAVVEKHKNLVFSHIGFESTCRTINLNSNDLNVSLEEELHIMGEVMIIEKPNIFEKTRNLFRKKY
ncbi:hypothetical protein MTsPCn5_30780 [Croceitalea sp. MTPC5]|uniref:carboxypeptidase-like regulatory domain-containing protein n=1 Tax=Croceitalea sp. MTPC5 TaxID=3056565 RepID=UPI002B3E6DF8|nr:hypothetical protein MTsPCn5_30780 [Croceitalea sp. MTPC5]